MVVNQHCMVLLLLRRTYVRKLLLSDCDRNFLRKQKGFFSSLFSLCLCGFIPSYFIFVGYQREEVLLPMRSRALLTRVLTDAVSWPAPHNLHIRCENGELQHC